MLLLLVFLKGFRLAATTTWDGAMYLHHPMFPWVQRMTPQRASVIGKPSGRTQAPLPTIGQILAPERARLALKLPHIRFVSVWRKHSADVHPHACRGHPPDPNAAFGRNVLARLPEGFRKIFHARSGLTNLSNPISFEHSAIPVEVHCVENRVWQPCRTRFPPASGCRF